MEEEEVIDGPTSCSIIMDWIAIKRRVDEAHHPPYLSWFLVMTDQLMNKIWGIMDHIMFSRIKNMQRVLTTLVFLDEQSIC